MNTTLTTPDLLKIQNYAKSLGFVATGWLNLKTVEPEFVSFYQNWLNRGYQGDMEYLVRHFPLKQSFTNVFSEVESIMVLAFPYKVFPTAKPPFISGYARGMDYHLILRKKLTKIANFITANFSGKFKVAVDSAPLPERYLARLAGLGWIGKSGNFIVPDHGPNVFLGEILTNLKVQPQNRIIPDQCGNCNLCLNNCPTGAINHDKTINTKLCLSAYTTEFNSLPPIRLHQAFSGRFFGCENCVSFCPHTKFQPFTPEELTTPLTKEEFIDLPALKMGRTFKNTTLSRLSRKKLLQNYLLAIYSGPLSTSQKKALLKKFKPETTNHQTLKKQLLQKIP
ncbi:MAG: tRNA epoxyqueuosine(34) reductase QueG [Deltaproteobacteria bacterium]|jgi:epoxyqueuosine reductase|nr:tRNA epoxyqueuosine(34) reductase QueG [Deltaproteobacteria bacterium]